MSTVRQMFDALYQVERFAQARGQKMVFSACSCCGSAQMYLGGSKSQRDLLMKLDVATDGTPTYSFPNEQNEKVVEALQQELQLAQLQ